VTEPSGDGGLLQHWAELDLVLPANAHLSRSGWHQLRHTDLEPVLTTPTVPADTESILITFSGSLSWDCTTYWSTARPLARGGSSGVG
jgi:hypothetical protein